MGRRLGVCGGGRALRLERERERVGKTSPLSVQTGLTADVYRMSGSTGTKCAGGIDEEHLMEWCK